MRKIYVGIIAAIVVAGLVWAFIATQIHTGVASKRQEDALAVSEANVDKGKEAKEEGEKATVRADKSKEQRTKQITQLKEEMYEKASSIDDLPLSGSDISILCRAYRSSDPVCSPTN